MNKTIRDKFYQVLVQDITPLDFKKWLYSLTEPDVFIHSNEYLELISIDYSKKFAFDEICSVIEKHVNLHEYEIVRLSKLLTEITEKQVTAHGAIEETYYLYCRGYKFFEKLGLNYGLDIAVIDCANQSFENMYPKIIQDAQKILVLLNSGRIVFKETINDYGLFKYDDLSLS